MKRPNQSVFACECRQSAGERGNISAFQFWWWPLGYKEDFTSEKHSKTFLKSISVERRRGPGLCFPSEIAVLFFLGVDSWSTGIK